MKECCFCKEIINKDERILTFEDDIMLCICTSCYEKESDTGEIY
jgi:hypothetical protein